MKADRAFGVAVLVTTGAFLLWRVSKSQGGRVTLVDDFEPGPASTAGTDGGGQTNPLSAFFASLSEAFKLPGNASVIPAQPAAPGSPVDPLAPPNEMTLTAQPEGYTFLGEQEFIPTLGDPNLLGWDFLASTPPDLFWDMQI